jgi:hypothetical protein
MSTNGTCIQVLANNVTINGNGYNIIKNSLLLKPGWKEVKKDELWNKMMGPYHSVNFIWKPTNFNYKVNIFTTVFIFSIFFISDSLFFNSVK